MKDSQLIKQSLEFSVSIVKYYKLLVYEMKDNISASIISELSFGISLNPYLAISMSNTVL